MPSLVCRAVVTAVGLGLGLALGGGAWAKTPWAAPESEKRPA
jgi:hypothetical protein